LAGVGAKSSGRIGASTIGASTIGASGVLGDVSSKREERSSSPPEVASVVEVLLIPVAGASAFSAGCDGVDSALGAVAFRRG
jgi:hypothetical protein